MHAKRMRNFWLIAMTLGLALAMALPALGAAPPEREIFRPQPYFFVAVRDTARIAQGFKASPTGEAWRDPAMAPLKQALAKASSDMKAAIGASMTERQTKDAAGMLERLRFALATLGDVRDFAFALYIDDFGPGFDKSAGSASAPPDMYLALQLSGSTLDSLRKVMKGSEVDSLAAPYRMLRERIETAIAKGEVDFLQVNEEVMALVPRKESEPIAGLKGDCLYISNDRPWMEAIGNNQAVPGGVDPLAEAFGADRARSGVMILQKMQPLWDFLESARAKMDADPNAAAKASERQKLQLVIDAFSGAGLMRIQNIQVRMAAGEDGFWSEQRIALNPDKPAGLMDFGDNKPFEVIDWLPPNVQACLDSRVPSGDSLWPAARWLARTVGGALLEGRIDAALDKLKVQTGIDFEKDVAANLGGHAMGWIAQAGAPAPMSVPLASLAIDSADPAALAAAMDKALEYISQRFPLLRQEAAEGACKTVCLPQLPFLAPAYGAIQDKFVLSTSAQAFQMAKQAAETGGDSQSRMAVRQAFEAAGMPLDGIGMSYSDPRPGIERLPVNCARVSVLLPFLALPLTMNRDLTPQQSQSMQTVFGAISSAALAMSQIDMKPIAAKLFPSTKVARMENGFYVERRRSALPEEMAVASAVACGVGALAAHNASKAVHRRLESQSSEGASAQTDAAGVDAKPPAKAKAKEKEKIKEKGAAKEKAKEPGVKDKQARKKAAVPSKTPDQP